MGNYSACHDDLWNAFHPFRNYFLSQNCLNIFLPANKQSNRAVKARRVKLKWDAFIGGDQHLKMSINEKYNESPEWKAGISHRSLASHFPTHQTRFSGLIPWCVCASSQPWCWGCFLHSTWSADKSKMKEADRTAKTPYQRNGKWALSAGRLLNEFAAEEADET